MRKKYLLLCVMVLIFIFIMSVLAGCSTSSSITQATSSVTNTSTSTSSTTASISSTRTITDMSGNQVVIPATINRIATQFPATNQIIFMLGAADRIVATTDGIQARTWFVKIYPRLNDIPKLFKGANVNLEELIAAKPDVAFIVQGNDALADSIRKVNIPVVMLAGFPTPESLQDGVRLIGDIIGGAAVSKANQFVTYYQGNIDKVISRTTSIPKEKRPKLYYCANGPLNTEGNETLVKIWMEIGGGVNIAAENGVTGGFKDVTMEDLAKWDPDFVICRDAPYKTTILSEPGWQSISAVKNDNVLVNPQGVFYWCVRSAEEALQKLWIAKTIHPDLFQDVDIVKEAKYFYKTFHYYDFTDAEIQEILNPVK